MVSESGPSHNKSFQVKCSLNDLKTDALVDSVVANGSSINRAKTSAAELILTQTKLDKPSPDKTKKKSKILNFLENIFTW